jgi:hypothetical protein
VYDRLPPFLLEIFLKFSFVLSDTRSSTARTRRDLLKFGAAGAIAAVGVTGNTSAQGVSNYPVKPVKVVVSFSAGGTTDVIARSVSQLLAEQFKQSFVIENKPGSGGNIGNELVARSAPDGYTLTVASVGPMAINPTLFKNLKYDPLTELTPIILIADVPNVLVMSPGSTIKTFAEFVAFAK